MKKFLFILLFVSLGLKSIAGGDDVKLISLFPVPLKSGTLNVNFNYSGSGVASIEIRNLIGKKIQEKAVYPGADKIYFVDLDTNPNGVYVVLAKDANGKVIEISKFILNK